RNGFAAWGRTLTSPNHIPPPQCGTRWSGYCMRIHRHRLKLQLVITLLAPFVRAHAQSQDLQQILDRLDRLDSENRDLREQVRELREQTRPAAAPAPEQTLQTRMDIEGRRTTQLP